MKLRRGGVVIDHRTLSQLITKDNDTLSHWATYLTNFFQEESLPERLQSSTGNFYRRTKGWIAARAREAYLAVYRSLGE